MGNDPLCFERWLAQEHDFFVNGRRGRSASIDIAPLPADNAPDALEVTADAPSSDDLLSRFLAVDSSEILRIRHEDDARQGKLYRRARHDRPQTIRPDGDSEAEEVF